MRISLLPVVILCLPLNAESFAQDGMISVDVAGDSFLVREGFELSRIAGPELIWRPTVCDWDDEGRLVVCESSGSHEGTEKQLTTKPHKLVRLIDEDGDGVFDHRIVAAEDLSFYSGVLCDGDDVYVSTPPSILKLTDADGDGVCESREVWHDGGTLTYCANDLHGPYKGLDGWIYWCKGAFGEQTHQLADGKTLKSKAAHVLRKRAEGGPVEIVISGGMDNPIELAFLPSGDLFFTSTFLHHPSGGIRDGIGHAVHGSLFGKRHNVIDGLPRTGDVMPVMTELGAAAPSGLATLSLGESDKTVLACAQFNLHKISRHTLLRDGATYRTIDEDLVTNDRLTFHPTDVIEDRDGSLIFLDTGDWYDLCCPSSGAEASNATGGVYRLRRVDTSLELNSDSQISSFDRIWSNVRENSPSSRQKLQNQLAQFDPNNPDQFLEQIAVLNALSRIGVDDLDPVRSLLNRSRDAAVCRAAAECLGLHGDRSCIGDLMQRLEGAGNDRTLEHSLLYAAMEINDTESLKPLVTSDSIAIRPNQARAAVLLLDQLDSSQLSPVVVLEALGSSDRKLKTIALDVLQRHPRWATTLLPRLGETWASKNMDQVEMASLLSLVTAWQSRPEIVDWITEQIRDHSTPARQIPLIVATSPKQIPDSWQSPISGLLGHASDENQLILIDWLSQQSLTPENTGIVSQLRRITTDESLLMTQRLRAAAALPKGTRPSEHGLSDRIVNVLSISENSDEQAAAMAALERIRLDVASATELSKRLNDVPTARFAAAVGAVALADESTAADLLERLPDLKSARTVSAETLIGWYKKYDDGLQSRAKSIAEKLIIPPSNIAKALAQLESELPAGDMVRGMRVFHSAKAACGSCHEFGDVGGRIGPELTRIGKSRSRLALLEAIVFPSSHIAQGYRSVRVLTSDGVVHTGLITSETVDELELTTGIDRVVKVAKIDIEEQHDSTVSVMPAGLEGSLSKQELADVMELLQVYSAW